MRDCLCRRSVAQMSALSDNSSDGFRDTVATASGEQIWTLEALGNWRKFKWDADGGGDSWVTQTRYHNAANEIDGNNGDSITGPTGTGTDWVDPTFDAAGNMTSGPRPGAEDTRLWLRYDAWNRLTHVSANSDHNPTIAEYRYDGLDRRISKAIAGGDTFHYYYNENWQVLEVTKGSAAYEQYVWDARYIDAPVLRWRDANNSEVDGLEETLFYTNDANMNVTALVDVSGNVVERYRYDAYGKVTFLAGTKDLAGNPTAEWTVRNASIADNQVLYCGYRFDPETGLYQVRYRMLHPTAGRWMQRDPAGYVGAMALHEYVASSPLVNTDWMGLLTDDECKRLHVDLQLHLQEWASIARSSVHTVTERLVDAARRNEARWRDAADGDDISRLGASLILGAIPGGDWAEGILQTTIDRAIANDSAQTRSALDRGVDDFFSKQHAALLAIDQRRQDELATMEAAMQKPGRSPEDCCPELEVYGSGMRRRLPLQRAEPPTVAHLQGRLLLAAAAARGWKISGSWWNETNLGGYWQAKVEWDWPRLFGPNEVSKLLNELNYRGPGGWYSGRGW